MPQVISLETRPKAKDGWVEITDNFMKRYLGPYSQVGTIKTEGRLESFGKLKYELKPHEWIPFMVGNPPEFGVPVILLYDTGTTLITEWKEENAQPIYPLAWMSFNPPEGYTWSYPEGLRKEES